MIWLTSVTTAWPQLYSNPLSTPCSCNVLTSVDCSGPAGNLPVSHTLQSHLLWCVINWRRKGGSDRNTLITTDPCTVVVLIPFQTSPYSYCIGWRWNTFQAEPGLLIQQPKAVWLCACIVAYILLLHQCQCDWPGTWMSDMSSIFPEMQMKRNLFLPLLPAMLGRMGTLMVP